MNTKLLGRIVYLLHCELVIDINMKNGNFIAAALVLELLRNSHDAGWGATIGLLLGMFIPPVGIILGSIAGAFLAEIIFAGSSVWTSMKSALGAFAGFIFGTGMKLIVSGLMLWKIIVYM